MRTPRILWFSIASSTFIYAGILWFLLRGHELGSFDDALRKPLVLPLYGLALLNFVIALFAFSSLKAREPKTGMIIRLALFESVAIFGLVAAFVSQDWRLYLPAWAVSLIGMIREWPSE